MTRSLGALALVCGLLGACNLNDHGKDPPRDRLFFPADLAIDPTGRFAFVTNANTDLRYNGGTITTVDLQVARDRIDLIKQTGEVPADCHRDVLDPSIVECSERGFILADRTIKIGNFAGSIVYQPEKKPKENGGRLFAVVRGDPSVVWSDVPVDGEGLLHPDCGTVGFVPCDRRLTRSELEQEFPPEPFGASLDPDYGLLYVAHFGGDGALSLFDVGGGRTRLPRLVDVATGFLRRSNDQAPAGFGVAARLEPNPTPCQAPFAYVTSRVSNDIAIASVRGAYRCGAAVPAECKPMGPEALHDPCTLDRQSLDLSRVTLAGLNEVESARLDIRDIVFARDGKNAYVVVRQPSALLVYDTAFLEGDSRPRLFGVRAIEVCAEPSHVSVYERNGQPRALVTCFSSGQMFVVDPQIGAPVTVFDLGHGPNGVHVAEDTTRGGAGAGGAGAGGAGAGGDAGEKTATTKLGVAVSFADQNLVLVDLQPGSSTEYKVVLRIGLTRPISR